VSAGRTWGLLVIARLLEPGLWPSVAGIIGLRLASPAD
jgi:hypothetical protein